MHLGNTCCMPFQVDPTWQFLQCDILGGRGKLAISVPPLAKEQLPVHFAVFVLLTQLQQKVIKFDGVLKIFCF